MMRILLLPCLLLIAACASTPAPSVRAGVDEAEIAAIEADVARAGELAADGLAAHTRDDLSAAAAALDAARKLLADAAARCGTTPGCPGERIVAAQQALIDAQTDALLGDHAADVAERGNGIGESELRDGSGTAIATEQARSARLLNGRDLGEIIEVNEAVRAALEEWLSWMRPQLLDTWEHYQYMRHLMWPAYEQAGLPEALLFGILAKESGGRVHAVSRAGAVGPLQFMPATGRRYGLVWDGGFDQRYDPAAATRANVAYLNDQLRLLNNDLELVLAAYNGGEGRLGRLSPGGSRRFWEQRVFDRLPAETREYVPMVLAAAWIFLHPEDFGVEWPAIDPTPSMVRLERAKTLRELSVCLAQAGNPRGWFRTLRNLNPRVDPALQLPAGSEVALPATAAAAYPLQCVSGDLAETARRLHEAKMPGAPPHPAVAATGTRTHLVRRGETLSSIARRYRCGDPRVIAVANGVRPPRYPIRAGQRLAIPPCSAS
jgi:membrane-bound lytic murein transglycosylase D